MSRRSLRRDLDLSPTSTEAWSDNWGFVPYSSATSTSTPHELQLAFDRNWFMVAETESGETAAIAITAPDVNQVLAKMNGRLLPLGWWHYLRKSRTIDRVRGLLSASSTPTSTQGWRPRSTSSISTPRRASRKWGEIELILESNRNMNRAMEAMGGRVVRRFRVYERDL